MIDGIIPDLGVWENAAQYDGQKCDCGMIIYAKEYCGCPGSPWQILARENPSYGR